MIVLFPQWQGSGVSNEIESGAKIIGNYFADSIDVEIDTSGKDINIHKGIIGYNSLYAQTENYRQLVRSYDPEYITTIGGDCSVSIIPVSYLNHRYGSIGIIWLDAHADLNTPGSSPSKTFHGMPLRLLAGDGDESFKQLLFSTIDTSQIVYIGLRDTDRPEEKLIKDHNIFHTRSIHYKEVKQKLIKHNYKKIYIHLDLDVIDPSYFQYSKCPSSCGISIEALEVLIGKLHSDFEVVGYSICECVANKSEQLIPVQNILELVKKGSLHNSKQE
jgi:arginase